jgi:hypothetical protein
MSIIENVLHANLGDMFQQGRQTLVVGAPKSGKTSFLLYCTALFYKLGEYVIVRDIGEYYEWFSMLDLGYKIKGFVPKGCRILFEHPNFEQVEFDITDMNTFFDQVEKTKINLLFFESFSQILKNHVKFWVDFFSKILPWKEKPGNGEKRFCIIIDEFGDIAPGKGRTYIPGQSMLSQLIAVNHRKFRRHNIRLVAAVHLFRDITFPIRTKFDCFCIRNNYAEPKELPFVLENYANVVTKLPVNKMLFVDSAKNFNEFEVVEEIKPLRFNDIYVQGIGVADELLQEARPQTKPERDRDRWRQRTAKSIDAFAKEGWAIKKIADLYELSEKEILRIRKEFLA